MKDKTLIQLFNQITFDYPSDDFVIIHTSNLYIEHDKYNCQLLINSISGNECKLIANINYDDILKPVECIVYPVINGKCQYENKKTFSIYMKLLNLHYLQEILH